jgi:hypothetical protein
VIPGLEPSHWALKALPYARYALAHGWTPWQVDNQVYAWLDDWLLPVEELIREVSGERSGGRAPAHGGQG